MKTLRRALRSLVATVGVAFLSGCYSYFPVETPAPGTTVRIRVPVSSAVQAPNAPVETIDLTGVVLTGGDSLIMETKNRREFGAFREVMEVDTLRVARSALSSVEQQVFSKPKTVGLTVLVAAGAAGIVAALVKAAGGQDGEPPPDGGGPPAQIRVKPVLMGLWGLIGR